MDGMANPAHYGLEPHDLGPKIRFSRQEILHLIGSVFLLTIAFSFILHERINGPAAGLMDFEQRLQVPPSVLLASFIAVSTGFVLHELAHKILAQHYGHWAEFRAQFMGLLVSVGIALGAGILFAAPGAVHILGRVTQRENGLISLMGPATNFLIALIAIPFTWTANTEGLGYLIAETLALVNAILCLFNLLPFGPLDGKKIMRWNWIVYTLSILASIALVVFVVLGSPF